MALTKIQALNKFCTRQGYQEQVPVLDNTGNPVYVEFVLQTKTNPETKALFLKRMQNEWAMREVESQIRHEKMVESELAAQNELSGTTLE